MCLNVQSFVQCVDCRISAREGVGHRGDLLLECFLDAIQFQSFRRSHPSWGRSPSWESYCFDDTQRDSGRAQWNETVVLVSLLILFHVITASPAVMRLKSCRPVNWQFLPKGIEECVARPCSQSLNIFLITPWMRKEPFIWRLWTLFDCGLFFFIFRPSSDISLIPFACELDWWKVEWLQKLNTYTIWDAMK